MSKQKRQILISKYPRQFSLCVNKPICKQRAKRKEMESETVFRPGHGTFLAAVGLFLILCFLLIYYLLTLPLCYFILGALIFYLISKYYSTEEAKKEAIFIKGHDKIDVCIVGAGFSGLCMAVKLKKAGIKFKILEKSSHVGGTWNANRYPGCRCDVWSALYQVSQTLNHSIILDVCREIQL